MIRLKELQALKLTIPYSDENTENYKRLRYCRYADDFICGVIGSYKDGKTFMDSVTQFLKEELDLDTSPEKTKIVRATKGIEFLGYKLSIHWGTRLRKLKTGSQFHLKRTISGLVHLGVPKHKIYQFNREKRYGNLQTMNARHRGGVNRLFTT